LFLIVLQRLAMADGQKEELNNEYWILKIGICFEFPASEFEFVSDFDIRFSSFVNGWQPPSISEVDEVAGQLNMTTG
jgi:hypothetical protein